MREKRPGERLLVGTRAANVDAADARTVVDRLGAAGADFVILDHVPTSIGDAVDWVHRTADVLGLDAANPAPLVSGRTWG
jgi:hypothetical protein